MERRTAGIHFNGRSASTLCRVLNSWLGRDLNAYPLRGVALKLTGSTDTSVALADILKGESAVDGWPEDFWGLNVGRSRDPA